MGGHGDTTSDEAKINHFVCHPLIVPAERYLDMQLILCQHVRMHNGNGFLTNPPQISTNSRIGSTKPFLKRAGHSASTLVMRFGVFQVKSKVGWEASE